MNILRAKIDNVLIIRCISESASREGVKKSYTFVKCLHLESFLFSANLKIMKYMDERTLSRQGTAEVNAAFFEIMDNYLPLISRTSYRIMCDRKDSEYVTIAVMLSVWRDMIEHAGHIPSGTELLRRTCRLCRRRLFRRRILTILSIDPDIFVAASPVVPSYDEYIARQAWQVFCRASTGFSDRQRIAYTLCELEGIPENTVSLIGGFRLVSVMTSLEEAREAVRDELDHYGRMKEYESYVVFLRKVEDQLTDKTGLSRQIMNCLSVQR